MIEAGYIIPEKQKVSEKQNPIYLSLAEAARLGGFSRKYLNVLIYRKKIPAEKMNGRWFIALEHFQDYLRQVKRDEPDEAAEEPSDRILGAYIRQSEFLQERFAELERQLIAERNEKQALFYELQHLQDYMEQTIQQRLAEMADELNHKILDMKVTERLETMQEKFTEQTLPIESVVAVVEERVEEKIEEKIPEAIPAAAAPEPAVLFCAVPLRRRMKYHWLNFWDRARDVSLRHAAATLGLAAVLLFMNFTSDRIAFPARVGFEWGEAAIGAMSAVHLPELPYEEWEARFWTALEDGSAVAGANIICNTQTCP